MSRTLRVSLVQLDVVDADPFRNLARATTLVEGAPPADLYLLPELWTSGYAHASWPRIARDDTPAVLEAVAAIAGRRGAIVGGSTISLDAGGALVNRFALTSPSGNRVAAYDKVHLFPAMDEPAHLRPGTHRVRVPVGGFTAGLSICYDLRFPEMYRLDALDGVDVFLVVSAWPAARVSTMQLLATARAIENQAYVVLCNRVGTGADGTRFGGGSCVIDPAGDVVAHTDGDETLVTATLDPDAIADVRGDTALLEQRRAGVDWQA